MNLSAPAVHRLPSLFLSHGSPMLAIEDSPTGRFLDRLGGLLHRPRAILVASAHFVHARPTLTATPMPETIHDFGGFPEPLYRIRYPTAGAPALAHDIAERLTTAGFDAHEDGHHGLDHGVWVPLRRMYPASDIPVVALSVNPSQSAEWHYRLGRALAPLRDEGVLVVGSGGFSHNLRALHWQHAQAAAYPWVTAFTDPLRAALLEGDVATALDWTSLPHAAQNHPTTEHLYPLYVALGAGGEGARGRLLHRDVEMGGLALDAFAFDTA
ncbi:dioxygenase family protein [Pseudoxanthomonas japonensis]|uniref:Dioxygenase n=1 Tax=Pseudoxanthomonas japonensis TaxID=69284 RepID=A0ABQ6ZG76_9GAMM|nr:class III extradiol ring-cleavage dioxygenase [Pseudoxanthomonas japonensis]KAF1724673.1 dioxygenase [Pseudoxanthomonas japonensis]